MKYFIPKKKEKWRNIKKRNISVIPVCKNFFPQSENCEIETIILNYDELEALKLKNIDNLWIIDWSKQMWISKSLFALIYKQAVLKVSQCLVLGKKLYINTEKTIDIKRE
jgi:predicted DNA-binding protein (UPF0251 family)